MKKFNISDIRYFAGLANSIRDMCYQDEEHRVFMFSYGEERVEFPNQTFAEILNFLMDNAGTEIEPTVYAEY